MKIVHFIDSGGLYGAEKVLIELARLQQKLGHEVEVCSLGARNEIKALDDALEAQGIKVTKLRFASGIKWKGVSILKQYLISVAADIYHSHGYKPNVLIALCRRLGIEIKWVVTLHGDTDQRIFTKSWLYHLLDKFAIKGADALVFVSAEAKKHYEKISETRNRHLTVIRNGIRLEQATLTDLPENDPLVEFFRQNEGNRVIGMITRLSYEKGVDIVLKAFKTLVSECSDYRLAVIGEGGERANYERLIKDLGIDPYVCLPGYVGNVRAFLKQIDCLLIGSRSEGLPVVLLEAMAAKVPVVTTKVGEIPSVLGDGECGWFVEQCEAQAVVQAMQAFRNASDKNAKVTRAYERLVAEFSSDVMANKYLQLYQRLVEVDGKVWE